MATTTKQWNDGSTDTLTLTYGSAEGSQSVQVTSQPDNGIDRTMGIHIAAIGGTPSADVEITQLGKRELFKAADGDFVIMDNYGRFAVLKQS